MNKVRATIINYVNHKTKDYKSNYSDKIHGFLYNQKDIKRLSKKDNNVNIDLFINKENDIFIFHQGDKENDKFINKNYSKEKIENTSTKILKKKYKLILFKDNIKYLKNARTISVELKNFYDNKNKGFSILKDLLSTNDGIALLPKIQFEIRSDKNWKKVYDKIKKYFPNNFFWKLVYKPSNLTKWIEFANEHSNVGLSIRINALNVLNLDKTLKNYKKKQITFWTISDEYRDYKNSFENFLYLLLKTKFFYKMEQIYILGEREKINTKELFDFCQNTTKKSKEYKLNNAKIFNLYAEKFNFSHKNVEYYLSYLQFQNSAKKHKKHYLNQNQNQNQNNVINTFFWIILSIIVICLTLLVFLIYIKWFK